MNTSRSRQEIHKRRAAWSIAGLAVLAGGMLTPLFAGIGSARAANVQLYLSPASSSLAQNATINVAVRVSTNGEPLNAVEADLSYDASRLQFLSIGSGDSAFTIAAPSSGGNGSVSINRANLQPVSGDILVATVSFKALTGSDSSNVSFKSSSQALRSTDNANVLSGTAGASFTFAAAGSAVTPSAPANPPAAKTASPADKPSTGSSGAAPTTTPPATNSSPAKVTTGSGATIRTAAPQTSHGANDKLTGNKAAVLGVSSLAVVVAVVVAWMLFFRKHHALSPRHTPAAAFIGGSSPAGSVFAPTATPAGQQSAATVIAPSQSQPPVGSNPAVSVEQPIGPVAAPDTAQTPAPELVPQPAAPSSAIVSQPDSAALRPSTTPASAADSSDGATSPPPPAG